VNAHVKIKKNISPKIVRRKRAGIKNLGTAKVVGGAGWHIVLLRQYKIIIKIDRKRGKKAYHNIVQCL
jgi:hypothetical protein